MAVKTRFSEAELVQILANYSLGGYTGSQPISAGSVQTNYLIQTTQGKFIFRCYENRSPGSVRFECNLIRYLKRQNYPCPAPLKNKQAKDVGEIHGKPFALFEFIEGQHLEHPSKAQESQLIQKVAELQILTRHYRPRGWQQRWNYSVPLAHKLAQETAEWINTANARQKLAWFNQEADKLDLPAALPKGICHCDFHFSNILFNDGQFTALIDFDDANYTFLTYDLVTLMNPFIRSYKWDTWFQFRSEDNIFDFSQARDIATQYMQYRPLSRIEKRHLFDVYKLSILFDCIWYFKRGDVRDFYEKRKIDALNRLGRDAFYTAIFD